MKSKQLARSSSVRCGLCMLVCRSGGRWTRWAAGDCFKNDNL